MTKNIQQSLPLREIVKRVLDLFSILRILFILQKCHTRGQKLKFDQIKH